MKPAAYLLDTNVVFETKKLRPRGEVMRFLASLPTPQVYLSVLSLGELRRGALCLSRSNPNAGEGLLTWVTQTQLRFGDRVLPVTEEIGLLWGELSVGRSRPAVDTLLAATAIHHNCVLVTRNTRDVQDLPVRCLNPWLA